MKDYEKWLKKLGKNIQKIRKEKGITQEEMQDSKNYGIAPRPYQRYEAGQISPTSKTLYRIAKRLGVSVQELFPDD